MKSDAETIYTIRNHADTDYRKLQKQDIKGNHRVISRKKKYVCRHHSIYSFKKVHMTLYLDRGDSIELLEIAHTYMHIIVSNHVNVGCSINKYHCIKH